MRRFAALLGILLLLVSFSNGIAQDIFPPPATPPEIRAIRASDPIRIDGNLSEPAWQNAQVVTELQRFQPNQGGPVSLPTEFRILFDDEYLYFGAMMFDTLGRAGIRVPIIRRDFDYFEHDMFSIALDGMNDARNSMVFQTNPYGAQRELLSLDATTFNRQWQTLWVVGSQIHDWGWSTEVAIPWKSIRYEAGAAEMRVVLMRIIRRMNERATFPPIPRAMNPYRMDYAAVITGLEPPPPSSNLQVTPYVLADASESRRDVTTSETNLKYGGEVKWAVDTRSVLDITWNTDFAQVDADRQVLNLTRFSVQFPEQRQFFLEGNEVYTMSARELIQPFFSRRIGLDATGAPIPIQGGLRYTRRGTDQTVGGLLIRQEGNNQQGAANFAVARYTRNLTPTTRLGAMATVRHDEPSASVGSNQNVTLTLDGFSRLSNLLYSHYMFSVSDNSDVGPRRGWAGAVFGEYRTNLVRMQYTQAVVSDAYDPRTGFIDARNYVLSSPSVTWTLRPNWLPDFVLELEPALNGSLYYHYDTGRFREGQLTLRALEVVLRNTASLRYELDLHRQRLDTPFRPLGTTIAPGTYDFASHIVSLSSDYSRKLAAEITVSAGSYFDGTLRSAQAQLRLAPIPQFMITANLVRNDIRGVGASRENAAATVAGAEVRFALNARFQWISYYQYNTMSEQHGLNGRLQWEYRPLSYFFLVLNDNRRDATALLPVQRIADRQAIVKLTYLRQF